jgi:hypothetical protein
MSNYINFPWTMFKLDFPYSRYRRHTLSEDSVIHSAKIAAEELHQKSSPLQAFTTSKASDSAWTALKPKLAARARPLRMAYASAAAAESICCK